MNNLKAKHRRAKRIERKLAMKNLDHAERRRLKREWEMLKHEIAQILESTSSTVEQGKGTP